VPDGRTPDVRIEMWGDAGRMDGERIDASFGESREIGIEACRARRDQLDAVAGRDEQRFADLRSLHQGTQEVRKASRLQHQFFTHADGSRAVRETDDDDHRLPPPELARTKYMSRTSNMQSTPAIVP